MQTTRLDTILILIVGTAIGLSVWLATQEPFASIGLGIANGSDLLDLLLDDPRLPTPIDEGHASAREPGSRVTETALTPRRDEANRGGPDTAK